MLIQHLLETLGPEQIETPEKIAGDVYALAEARVADQAADEGGFGFERNAIAAEVDKILIDVKSIVHKMIERS
jgi:hypothetical protein